MTTLHEIVRCLLLKNRYHGACLDPRNLFRCFSQVRKFILQITLKALNYANSLGIRAHFQFVYHIIDHEF